MVLYNVVVCNEKDQTWMLVGLLRVFGYKLRLVFRSRLNWGLNLTDFVLNSSSRKFG